MRNLAAQREQLERLAAAQEAAAAQREQLERLAAAHERARLRAGSHAASTTNSRNPRDFDTIEGGGLAFS